MWWEEDVVQNNIKRFLINKGWTVFDTTRRQADIIAEKYLSNRLFRLIMETKGDVRKPKNPPNGQRNKYIQIALGQVIGRTSPQQCGYNTRTILGIGIPDPCKDGTHFFINYLNDHIAPYIKRVLKLCIFTVKKNGRVVIDIAPNLPDKLF